jgi:hypothetical protein
LWISNEGPGVLRSLTTTLVPPPTAPNIAHFIVGVGGTEAVAISDPHGRWLVWGTSNDSTLTNPHNR